MVSARADNGWTVPSTLSPAPLLYHIVSLNMSADVQEMESVTIRSRCPEFSLSVSSLILNLRGIKLGFVPSFSENNDHIFTLATYPSQRGSAK